MVTPALLEHVKTLPALPGVYVFKDADDAVVYVGKAKSLRSRVASYFHDARGRSPREHMSGGKIERFRAQVAQVDVTITDTEAEALLLENELIKRHQPPFNVQLKDDKSFPFVMVTVSERFPRVRVIRGPHLYAQDDRFFGPYVDKGSLVRTLKALRKIFPYCSCKDACTGARRQRARPCLYYQLKLCPAPCTGKVTPAEYGRNVRHLIQFLAGESTAVVTQLRAEMDAAARALDFERAAKIRDQLAAVEKTLGRQAVVGPGRLDQDVVNFHVADTQATVVIFFVREGKLVGKRPYVLNLEDKLADDLLQTFVAQYYLNPRNYLPGEIVVPAGLVDLETIERAIVSRRGPVRVHFPEPGSREVRLLEMARKNAKFVLGQREIRAKEGEDALVEVYAKLGPFLPGLHGPPRHLEGFDISNIQGTDATGSMVYFEDGYPSPKRYRKYKIRGKHTPDDYAMMAEVLRRRYSRLLREDREFPDLVLVDGGKGQLNVALEALAEVGVDLPVIGLAKREEQVFVPGRSDPVDVERDSLASLLFQRVRDEAHRFAISYHKHLRQKRVSESPLEVIKGVGPATRTKLLRAFGAVEAVAAASMPQLVEVVPERVARAIHAHFHAPSSPSRKKRKK